MEIRPFKELYATDYETYIKKKDGGKDKEGEKIILSYLSWATAHRIMKELDPNSKIIEHEFKHFEVLSGTHEDFLVETEKPYRAVGSSSMVKVSVVLFGKTETENFAVANYRGQPIPQPTAVDVNKALKRAFVKALAKHGIALYLYEGEDIPEPSKIDVKELEKLEKILEQLNEKTGKENIKTLIDTVNKYTRQNPVIGKPIKKIENMTVDQSGIFKIAANKIGIESDKKLKEK